MSGKLFAILMLRHIWRVSLLFNILYKAGSILRIYTIHTIRIVWKDDFSVALSSARMARHGLHFRGTAIRGEGAAKGGWIGGGFLFSLVPRFQERAAVRAGPTLRFWRRRFM